jgi:hypothetical protein
VARMSWLSRVLAVRVIEKNQGGRLPCSIA